MSAFDDAFDYVIGNEGSFSNEKADHGGETRWGITKRTAAVHRCPSHPTGIQIDALAGEKGKDLARHIYRVDFWRFDGVRDRRLAIKLFDIVVNFADPIRLIQRAGGVTPDGIYGPQTEAAITRMSTDDALEALCREAADRYVEIVRHDEVLLDALKTAGVDLRDCQLWFLKGWLRRAIRRPRLEVRTGVNVK